MKKIKVLLCILFFSSNIVAQEFMIPDLIFLKEVDSINNYIELLNLDDDKSLIIKTSTFDLGRHRKSSEFIVYQNDGKILKFKSDSAGKIKRKKVDKKNYFFYWYLLCKYVADNRFEIQKDQLNIKSKLDGNGEKTILLTTDGFGLSIEIWKEKKHIVYLSMTPYLFINEKYPGHLERQKLVDLVDDHNNLFKLN